MLYLDYEKCLLLSIKYILPIGNYIIVVKQVFCRSALKENILKIGKY